MKNGEPSSSATTLHLPPDENPIDKTNSVSSPVHTTNPLPHILPPPPGAAAGFPDRVNSGENQVTDRSSTRFAGPLVEGKRRQRGWKRGLAIIDLLLRLVALAASLTAAIMMGTANESIPFLSQFLQFQANFSDFPAFTFFVIANAIASGYLFISLLFSIAAIVNPRALGIRLRLAFDTVMMGLIISGASASAAVNYLIRNGNSKANWLAICQQFNDLCNRTGGSIISSFMAVFIFLLLIVFSALFMRTNH